MNWKQSTPTEAGIYLRSNPPISFICRQDVFDIDGVLCAIHGASDESKVVPISSLSHRFWWYGPIPQPDWKSQPT